jgi:hypothetical protein
MMHHRFYFSACMSGTADFISLQTIKIILIMHSSYTNHRHEIVNMYCSYTSPRQDGTADISFSADQINN